MKRLIVYAVAAIATLSATAMGQALFWDFRGNDGQGPIGNQMIFEAGGVTVTATAWSYTDDGGTAFEEAALGQWSTGLGVRNPNEPSGSPEHQVSNADGNDFVLFVFEGEGTIGQVVIDPHGTHDNDVTYWTGHIDTDTDLSGLNYSDLAGLGFFDEQEDLTSPSDALRSVAIVDPGVQVNAILFGAWIEDSPEDYFKIAGITADGGIIIVPEPGSAALAALGLMGFILRRRR